MTDSDTNYPQLLKTDTVGRVRSTPEQRDAVLDAFEASALSGPEFARVHGINYQTFATWRQKRKRRRQGEAADPPANSAITLMEATLSDDSARGLRIEIAGSARLLIRDRHDAKLAAQLLAELQSTTAGAKPC